MSDSSPAPLSPQRLREARRLGLSPRSPELTAGVLLLTAGWVGYACLPPLGAALRELVAGGFQWTGSLQTPVPFELSPACLRVVHELLRIGAACWAAALLTDLAQVGFVWSPVTLLPHEERISPASGLARMVSAATLVRSAWLSIQLACGIGIVALLGSFVLRAAASSEESLTLLRHATTWTSLTLASVGATCLLFGIVQAWHHQTRWRQSLEKSEEEQRQRD